MVEMELREIQINHLSPQQVVVLEEKNGHRSFPIFIGPYEAEAADQAVHRRKAPRPMTHDLIVNVVEGMDGQLEGVIVDKLANETFHAKLLIRLSGGNLVKIDCRPSDAIVVATKADVPIFVAEEVLEKVLADEE